METLPAMVALGVLFVLFALSRAGERTRPCGGRSRDGAYRCRSCPLRLEDGAVRGRCPGEERRTDPPSSGSGA